MACAIAPAKLGLLRGEIDGLVAGVQTHIGALANRLKAVNAWQPPFGYKRGAGGHGQPAIHRALQQALHSKCQAVKARLDIGQCLFCRAGQHPARAAIWLRTNSGVPSQSLRMHTNWSTAASVTCSSAELWHKSVGGRRGPQTHARH